MHLNGALPGQHVPLQVTRGALRCLVTHRYTYAPPRCRNSQYSRTFITLLVSLWNDLAYSVFDGVGLAGFKRRANAFFIGLSIHYMTKCALIIELVYNNNNIIIIKKTLKQDYKIQLANHKIQMAWLTSRLEVQFLSSFCRLLHM